MPEIDLKTVDTNILAQELQRRMESGEQIGAETRQALAGLLSPKKALKPVDFDRIDARCKHADFNHEYRSNTQRALTLVLSRLNMEDFKTFISIHYNAVLISTNWSDSAEGIAQRVIHSISAGRDARGDGTKAIIIFLDALQQAFGITYLDKLIHFLRTDEL